MKILEWNYEPLGVRFHCSKDLPEKSVNLVYELEVTKLRLFPCLVFAQFGTVAN